MSRWRWDFEAPSGTAPGSSPPPPPDAGPLAPPPAAAGAPPPAAPPPPPAPEPPPSTPGPPPPTPERPLRGKKTYLRRRGVALLLVAALIALVAAVVFGSSHRHGRRLAALAGSHRPSAHGAGTAENELDGAVLSTLAYTPFVREGGHRVREIALTFDDGPGPYTPGVLRVLERYHVHATFFVVGRMERYFSASTIREVQDGDVIGDHTEDHPMLAALSAHEQREQLFEQIARVELLGGRRPVLFRPPYGSFDAVTLRELRRMHLLMVLWSVDTNDYRQPGTSVIIERVLAGARPGAIILMHDAGGARSQTIAALPAIIRRLRARGFRLVTVPRLLRDDPPPAGQPLPSGLAGD